MKIRLTALAAAIGAIPALSSAITLEDYLIANSTYDEAYINGGFSASDVPTPNSQVGYQYDLRADYEKTFTTLPTAWNYSVSGFATGARAGQTSFATDAAGNVLTDALGNPIENDDDSSDFGLSFRGSYDNYFHESAYPKAFWFGQGSFQTQDSAPDDDVNLTVGLGYGRVYNATPLAEVLRIVEELNEEGLLTGPIPDAVLLETAEVIDREPEFIAKYGRAEYRRDYYAAIEAALARSGAIRDGSLGALGALTIDQVLEDEPISNRRHGWVVRAGAGFQASDISGISDNDPSVLLSFEYAKPYGFKGQLINLLTYQPVFGDNTVQVITNELSYTHEMSDQIDWINSWNFGYRDGDGRETTSHQLLSSYRFFLNNSLTYDATLSITQTDVEPNATTADADDPTINFTTGFTYRLK